MEDEYQNLHGIKIKRYGENFKKMSEKFQSLKKYIGQGEYGDLKMVKPYRH